MWFAKTYLAAAIVLGIACEPGLSAETVAITNVTIINPRTQVVQAHRTIVIEDGRIRAIQPASARVPRGVRLINGKQKFIIPGLWDAHVHLSKAGVLSLPLFVANGVTSVRDSGSDLKEVLEWRARIEAGTLLGPRIKTGGQLSIRNTRRINGVMLRGRWLDRANLDRILREIERGARSDCVAGSTAPL